MDRRWYTLIVINYHKFLTTRVANGCTFWFLHMFYGGSWPPFSFGSADPGSPHESPWAKAIVAIVNHPESTWKNAGWWFGTWVDYDFPYVGNNHPKSQVTHIFRRGWNHQPVWFRPWICTCEIMWVRVVHMHCGKALHYIALRKCSFIRSDEGQKKTIIINP